MFNRSNLAPLIIAVAFFLIVTINIQSSPMTGISDNGDFARTTIWLGVNHMNGGDGTGSNMGRVERFYEIKNSFKYGGSFSSGLSLVFFAKLINQLFHPGIFDLKVLGIINTLAFSTGIFFVFCYLTKINKLAFYVSIPLVLLAFTDVSYTAYFNSFYEESYGMIFTLFTIAFFLKSIVDKNKKNAYINLLLVTVSSIFLISSKPQYFVLFIPLVLFIQLLFRSQVKKSTLLTVSFIICMFAICYYTLGTPKVVKKWNIYNTVFAQVLGSASDRSHALKILGIDNKYIKYVGIPAYVNSEGVNDPEVQKYLKISMFFRVIKYYLTRPLDIFNLSQDLAKVSFSSIIPFLSYSENSATPSANGIRLWSDFKMMKIVKFYMLQSTIIILSLTLVTVLYFKYKTDIFGLGIFFSLATLSQFSIVLVSEGLFGVPEKHLLLFNVFRDVLFFYWVLLLIFWVNSLVFAKHYNN